MINFWAAPPAAGPAPHGESAWRALASHHEVPSTNMVQHVYMYMYAYTSYIYIFICMLYIIYAIYDVCIYIYAIMLYVYIYIYYIYVCGHTQVSLWVMSPWYFGFPKTARCGLLYLLPPRQAEDDPRVSVICLEQDTE